VYPSSVVRYARGIQLYRDAGSAFPEVQEMSDKTFDPSRRRLFRQGAVIASGAALGGLMLKVKAPAQGGKVSQAIAKYQATPHGTQQCDGCMQYIPGKTPSANGTCKIVEGSISPKGWCMFFAPKS
jgi:High potential iron-sulfur protein